METMYVPQLQGLFNSTTEWAMKQLLMKQLSHLYLDERVMLIWTGFLWYKN